MLKLCEMATQSKMKTKKLIETYLASSLIYLVAQGMLNAFTYFKLENFSFHSSYFHSHYFISPTISVVLILSSYLVLRRFYHSRKEHYLLPIISWSFLFIPQIIPQFFDGSDFGDIVYTTWTFILTTTAIGAIIFQDLALVNVDNVPRNAIKFIYDDLKFYLDKLSFAWLTLGTVLAVGMTIILTAPMTSLNVEYAERMFWAVYTIFCFMTVTLLLVIFTIYPIFKDVRKLREDILEEKRDVATPDNCG